MICEEGLGTGTHHGSYNHLTMLGVPTTQQYMLVEMGKVLNASKWCRDMSWEKGERWAEHPKKADLLNVILSILCIRITHISSTSWYYEARLAWECLDLEGERWSDRLIEISLPQPLHTNQATKSRPESQNMYPRDPQNKLTKKAWGWLQWLSQDAMTLS